MMNFKNFCEYFKNEMENRMGYDGGHFSIEPMVKNNQQIYQALFYKKESNGTYQSSPCIYLEQVYQDYKNGEKMEDLLEKTTGLIHKTPPELQNLDRIMIRNEIKDRVFPTLINARWNQEMLKTVPHKNFLDLAVIYKIKVGSEHSATITNPMMKAVGMTLQELDESAQLNLEKQESLIQGMEEMLGISAMDEMNEDILYVVTNKEMAWGTGFMQNPKTLEKIAEKLGGDYYIIPSSVHEFLAIKEDERFIPEELSLMIQEINASQVTPEERLGDQPYLYQKESKQLSIPLEEKKEISFFTV